MSTRRIAVVSAGLSVPSSTRLLADRLAAATGNALDQSGIPVEVQVVELRRHARELADHLVTGFPPEGLRAAIDTVGQADGVIAVTPVYSGSYSGLFKTFVDVLDKESLVGRPVLLGATAGTARHSLVLEHAMRPLFAYLRAVVVPTAVFAAPEDWAGSEEQAGGALAGRIARGAGELAELLVRSTPGLPVDPFRDVTPMDQLLSGG